MKKRIGLQNKSLRAMRKIVIFILVSLLSGTYVMAQTATEIITEVRKSQELIKTISYRIVRRDTLVTGDLRTLTGYVNIRVETSDHNFGFLFWAKEDSVKSQLVYDGKMFYRSDEDQKNYTISTD